MKRLLLLIALVFAWSADAAVTWTCTKDFQSIEQTYYEVVGVCTATGTYTTTGDAVGSAATATAAAAALCHSSSQTIVDVVISTSPDGAPVGQPLFGFDHTNFKIMAFCASPCTGFQALTTGAATVSTGCVASIVTSSSNVLCTDQTAAAAVKCTPGAGTISMAGTGSDVINYLVVPPSGPVGECVSGYTITNFKFRFRAVCK